MSKINKERIGKVNRSDCHMSWKVFICFDSKWVLIGNQFVFIFYILSSTVGGYWASDWNDSKIHLKYGVDCCLLFIQFSQKWIMILMDFHFPNWMMTIGYKVKGFLAYKIIFICMALPNDEKRGKRDPKYLLVFL